MTTGIQPFCFPGSDTEAYEQRNAEIELQEWVQRDLLILHCINTSDNYAVAMTKLLARTLFYQHMNYIMGKTVLEYAHKMMDLVVR